MATDEQKPEGVDLSDLNIDVKAWVRGQAEVERKLLVQAQQEPAKGDDSGYLAATELLLMYVEEDPFHAPDVLAAVERGARMIAQRVLNEGRPNISPLMYFGRDGGSGHRRSDDANLERLQLRKRIGWHLSAKDARIALTQECGNESPRDEWPDTLGEVETYLVDYVLVELVGKPRADSEGGVGRANRRVATEAELKLALSYVHDSFAWLPWNKPEAPVTYPASWEPTSLDT